MKCPHCGGECSDLSLFCGKCGGRLPSSDNTTTRLYFKESLTKGAVISGKYRIGEKLGAGGMGVVFQALDTRLQRAVALKFLPVDLTREAEYKRRFIQEAQACSQLDHPNVCTVYEIGESVDSRMFIAMALCEGETLKARIQRGPLPIPEAMDVALQIGRGLSKAHGLGIVHRDIKPGNIFLTTDGIVKILDFGLAKLSGRKLTRTDAVMGTVSYMSPEQAGGENVGIHTDIWSLGVVLYEMLTGRLPFDGEHAQSVLYAIRHHSPPAPSELNQEIPGRLERIIYRCLQVKPEKRYASVQGLMTDISGLTRSRTPVRPIRPAPPVDEIPPPKEAERRQATVMMIGISGVSGLYEKMEVEDAAAILRDWHRMVLSVAERYEGRVKKITEYGFSIFFGVPHAIEHGPTKAVAAAIELRRRLGDLNRKRKLKTPLRVHIGVNTGIVLTGVINGESDDGFPVMGDTVNLAVQLKDQAADGEIHVGPSTHKYTRQDFDFDPVESLVLPGRSDPIKVYAPRTGKKTTMRTGPGAERMIHSAMVGRDGEMDRLKLHLFKAINGEGSILNIMGEAGIGKSRLISEALRISEISKVDFLKGRSLSMGTNLSFHPLIDLIRNWCSIQENDSPAVSLRKLEQTIQQIHPDGREEIFPFIATLMGMKLSGPPAERVKGIEGDALTKLILKNLRELLGRAAERRPLVFVMEDLHWADLTSIEFLESLFRLAETHPILFVNVFRPGHDETGERIRQTVGMRHRGRVSEISLESLDELNSEALINNLLRIRKLPSGIRELIIKRTGGNPFFIEEVVRSLIDEGAVEVRGGEFHVTEKIDSVEVPETINEVLMGRMDKLDESTRSLLRTASVIGRNFFYKILSEVNERTDDLDSRLELLKQTQLILERRRMDELEYLFKHALAQEAVYESILLKTRKRLHLRTAAAIESVFSDRLHEFYGMLALHYSKGEDLGRAETYLVKAGEEALKSSASSEALNYFKEALRIYRGQHGSAAEAGQIAILEKNIAVALFNKGQYVEADDYFSRALAFYGETFPRRRFAIATKFALGLTRYLLKLYFPPLRRRRKPSARDSEIINLLYKKNTALIILNSRRMFIESFYWLPRLFNFDLNEIENGIGILSMSGAAFSYGGLSFRLSRKVNDYVKHMGDYEGVKSRLYFKVPEELLAVFSGAWKEVKEFDRELVEGNIKIGELFYATGYIMTHGYYQIAKGNFALSMELAGIIDNAASMYENDNARAAFYWYKTQVLVNFSMLGQALEVAEKGIAFTRKKGFKPYLFSLHAFKARIEILQGRLSAAESTLKNAEILEGEIEIAPYILNTYLLARLLYNLTIMEAGAIEGAGGIPAGLRRKTRKLARRAVRNSRKSAADIPEACKMRGVLEWMTGRRQRARRWWEKSLSEGKRMGTRLELGRVYMEAGKRMSAAGAARFRVDGLDAGACFQKAREFFQECGLQFELVRWSEETAAD